MELKKTLNMPKGSFEMRGNLPEKEPKYIEHCQSISLYKKILDLNKNGNEFYLHDGPPYANGDLHAGHGLNMVLKDFIIRYKSLEGYHCDFVPGWDTHGLPIENEITKSGVDRHSICIAEFRKLCLDYAKTQVGHQKKQAIRLGLLGHFENPYITFQPEYESYEISIFAKMYNDGLVYRGLKPVHWSPISETACAQADIEYQNLPARSLFVKFKVKKPVLDLKEGDSFVIWTTTPWTIPSNLAVCLNPDMDYGIYKTDQGRLIFLASLEEKLVEEIGLTNVKLISIHSGKELEGTICQHPFYERNSLVIVGKHVTSDDGTGCVHTAPGLGEDDYKIGKLYGLDPYCPVDTKGRLTSECGDRLSGLFYEKANEVVIEMLQESGCLLKEEDITHSYPVDARNHKPLIFRTAPQWFCSVDKIREKLIVEASKVNFIPEWGKVRLTNMLAGRTDWCISRQRAWGVPIPIIYGEDGLVINDNSVFEKIQEEIKEHGSNIWYEKDANYFLPEGFKSSHSPNGIYTKENDIMDVWFDSGSSWLGANIARNLPYPADLYLEGNDQYRGWYNASMILSVAINNTTPFKNVITNGFIVDQNGQKFSKSKKNGIYPEAICNNYGADVFRLWVASIDYTTAEISLTQDLLKSVSDSYRKIRNTFKFMLANLYDNETKMFDISKDEYELSFADKMILNHMTLIENQVKEEYDSYNFLGVSTTLINFMVNDLSSWYLDISKDVLYCDTFDSKRRKAIQYVMYNLTKSLSILYAPILFFTSNEAYQALPNEKKEDIMLEHFENTTHYDEDIEKLYSSFIELRNKSNKALEEARTNGIIKGSNEGIVFIGGKDYKELLSKFDEQELARLLGFSNSIINLESDEIKVVKSKGIKCDRCWNYFSKVNSTPEGNLCDRCLKAYEGFENK